MREDRRGEERGGEVERRVLSCRYEHDMITCELSVISLIKTVDFLPNFVSYS